MTDQEELDNSPTGEEEEEAFSEPGGFFGDLHRRSYTQDIRERKNFADRAYGITQTWVGFLIVISVGQFICGKGQFGLTETEFNVVFTTTTASVFGFWILVGKYLFNPRNSHNHQS